MTHSPDDYLSQILRALSTPTPTPTPPSQPNVLGSLFSVQPQVGGPTGLGSAFLGRPKSSALSGLAFGVPPQAAFPSATASALQSPATRVRRVFYSFHYADVNRVNQVRQSGKIRQIDSERVKTVQDRSLWERKKSVNEEYLRKSIGRNILGTSATCILTGEHTWARPWCRFEIARSLLNGNGVFAVRIGHLWCVGKRCYGARGPNPLDHMAVGKDEQGRIYVYEYMDGGWYKMSTMMKQLMRWPKWLTPVANGYVQPLSEGAPIYDYDCSNGSRNLLVWANQAARSAGR